MRRSKEIIVLLVLLVGTMAFVLWYVADRKAKMRAEQNRPRPTSAAPAETAAPTVTLGGANEQKTIDFSSGQAVVKDTAEDKAAMDAALKDIAVATEDVSFGPSPKKKTEPAAPAPNASTPPPKS